MNRMLKFILILSGVFIHAGVVLSSDKGAGSDILITSVPEGASVFHYLRGKNHFLGYTPLRLGKDKLEEKSNARIRLIRFGYRESLVDVALDGAKKAVVLDREAAPYLKTQGNVTPALSRCSADVESRLAGMIRNNISGKYDIRLPFIMVTSGKGIETRVMMDMPNHDDVRIIEKIKRHGDGDPVDHVEQMIRPVATQLIDSLDDVGCVNVIVIVAAYQDKGLRMDFTPYLQNWSTYDEGKVGDTKVVTITYGTKMELYSSMIQTKNEKSFMFQYRLH